MVAEQTPASTPNRSRLRSHRVGQGLSRTPVTVYLTADERAILEERANNYGVSMSRVLVDGALHSAKSEFVDGATLTQALSIMTDMQRQIRGMAGNLNQLAHHANATQDFPLDAANAAKHAKAMLARLEEVLASVTR